MEKDRLLPFVTTWLDLEGIVLREISQRKTNAVRSHLRVESKSKREAGSDTETNCWLPGGRAGRGGVGEGAEGSQTRRYRMSHGEAAGGAEDAAGSAAVTPRGDRRQLGWTDPAGTS